jgi:putative ABC transport system permease protein
MRLTKRIKLLPGNRKIPLAWLLLKRQPIKLATAIVGIVFAATLILMQLGFRAALFESSVGLIKGFNADLILVNKLSVSSTGLIGFDRYRLSQIESNSSVEKTIPVRWDYVLWKYANTSENKIGRAHV